MTLKHLNTRFKALQHYLTIVFNFICSLFPVSSGDELCKGKLIPGLGDKPFQTWEYKVTILNNTNMPRKKCEI